MTRVVPPAYYGPAVCHACDAPIVWCLSDTGRRLPLDREPAREGGPFLLGVEVDALGDELEDGAPRARLASPDELEGPRWRCHWVTCRARRKTP